MEDTYVRLIFNKEEEFLEEYYGTVEVVLPQLGIEWQPIISAMISLGSAAPDLSRPAILPIWCFRTP